MPSVPDGLDPSIETRQITFEPDVTSVTPCLKDAVSVHVYCRPYDECDIYDVEQSSVRRVRLADDSVPPLSAAAWDRGGVPRSS